MKIFIDTNIPIYHRPIDQIDWKTVTESDDVSLLLSVMIFDELDKHANTLRQATRAKTLRDQLYNFAEKGAVKGDIKAELITKPHTRILENYGLDPGQYNSWILGSVKDYMEKNPDEQVTLVTADFGTRIRAQHLKIPVVILNETYRVNVEGDNQKENKRLKLEIVLKSSISKLSVVLGNKTQAVAFEIQQPNFKRYVEIQIADIKRNHAKVFEDEKWSHHLRRAYTKIDAIAYNSQLEEFYGAFRKYLLERKERYFADCLTIVFPMTLKNSGDVLAKHIDIEFTFPAVFISPTSTKLRLPEPSRPNPPVLGEWKPLSYSSESTINEDKFPARHTLPKIEVGKNETTVAYRCIELEQDRGFTLHPLFITLPKSNLKGFEIKYSIRCENFPDVVEGSLNVEIRVA